MSSWLQHLRDQSPKTRHRIALGTSVGVTCLIFVMWVTVLNFGMNEPTESLQAGTDGETQTASPLSAFGSNAASAFKQFKSKLSSSDDGPASTSSDPVDSDDFWSDSQTASASQARTESKESESEPFTSRNYNPNQESEWFSE